MISLGLKYIASSVPVVCFTGVAIGVGIIFGFIKGRFYFFLLINSKSLFKFRCINY